MINLEVKGESYKLKLTTQGVVSVENRTGKSPLEILNADDMPKVGELLVILHEAINTYNHGFKMERVYSLFDDYLEEHQYTDFVILIAKLLQDGGYIPKEADLDNLGNA